MRYKLKCHCGATCWARGSHDDSVNATEINGIHYGNDTLEWEGGVLTCQHDEFEIVDHEYDDRDAD